MLRADRSSLALNQPVGVETRAPASTSVVAIVPCHNRPGDLTLVLGDLANCSRELAHATRTVSVRVVVVDNASTPPIGPGHIPPGLECEIVRLARNAGGSGGFTAGIAAALRAPSPEFLWLVDSDARVNPGSLTGLLDAFEHAPGFGVLGPAIADPQTGEVHEVGGRVERRSGGFEPLARRVDDPRVRGQRVVACDYVASCCALVRADAAARAGLFPPTFLNADDVEWCIRLARSTGLRVGVVPGARASHPRFDRFPLAARYFGARNAMGPIDALGLSPSVRFRRALVETSRAINQELMDRPDLARLHLAGLRDAARPGVREGLPKELTIEPLEPPDRLPETLRDLAARAPVLQLPPDLSADERARVLDSLRDAGWRAPEAEAPDHRTTPVLRGLVGAALRALLPPRHDVAIVPAKGRPTAWFAATTLVELAPGGFVVRRPRRARVLGRAAWALARGVALSARLAALPRRSGPLPPLGAAGVLAPAERSARARTGPEVSVVVLSHNRASALGATLDRLRFIPALAGAEVIVADNASSDSSREVARSARARVVELTRNAGVGGFNAGADRASGELVLILDDDARPESNALGEAVALLRSRPEIGAVTFVPVHPATGAWEWPAARARSGPRDDWPVMGCCNLVRAEVWRALGGYDERFFLYRNDTDLAMRILACGLGVRMDPAWLCEHDSPAAARKSVRWCRLATRNWIWLARRHGRGAWGLAGLLMGWAWAHRQAGARFGAHAAVLRGVAEGIARRPTALPNWVSPDGRAFERHVRMQLAR